MTPVSTLRTDLPWGEHAFIGWVAPRGIVAAATASTFGTTLAANGLDGAATILPATFLVIVVTVTLCGSTAAPVARRLGVTRPARTRPLLVGNDPWVLDLAVTLRSAGLDVLMWSVPGQRERVRQAGIELAPEGLLAEATARDLQIEGITALPLLTTKMTSTPWRRRCSRPETSTAPSIGWHPRRAYPAWCIPMPPVKSCSAPTYPGT